MARRGRCTGPWRRWRRRSPAPGAGGTGRACRRSARHRRRRRRASACVDACVRVHLTPSAVMRAGLALARDLAGRLARRLQADAAPGRRRRRARRRAARAARRRAPAPRRAPGPSRGRRARACCMRAAPAVRLVVADQAVDQRLAGHRLQLRIERGADRQAALVELLLAVAVGDLAAHLLGEDSPTAMVFGESDARIDAERLALGLVGRPRA